MALDASTRQAVVNYLMRRFGFSITKAQLLETVNAVDDWCEANISALNTAIPLPQRSVLTTAEKATLLSIIAKARAGFGPEV